MIVFCRREKEKQQRRIERKKNKTIIRYDRGWTRKKVNPSVDQISTTSYWRVGGVE
jgi:hypothetical protein